MGKAVRINVRAYPIALGAMFALDADSVASADASDVYAAHIVLAADRRAGLMVSARSLPTALAGT